MTDGQTEQQNMLQSLTALELLESLPFFAAIYQSAQDRLVYVNSAGKAKFPSLHTDDRPSLAALMGETIPNLRNVLNQPTIPQVFSVILPAPSGTAGPQQLTIIPLRGPEHLLLTLILDAPTPTNDSELGGNGWQQLFAIVQHATVGIILTGPDGCIRY